jgi:peptidoglycan/xylan/chitin deacetylase (PgdA/CDA1 family)
VSAALAITVDVDGEAGLPDGGRGHGQRLTSRSERTYGLHRGLPRILDVLDTRATFYVPGITAQRHPDEIAGIVERGHELGHHGHTHRRPDELSGDEQRTEIVDGLAALAPFGARPLGYRAPGWELTPTTLALLVEHGFEWDSSLMGDDRPHRVESLIELPVHWSLDDAPFFAASPAGTGLWETWRRAIERAARESQPLTLTLHPEILGRHVEILERTLELAASLSMPLVTHGELNAAARRCGARRARSPSRASGRPRSAAPGRRRCRPGSRAS